MTTFGQHLVAWRRARGLTQAELAARARIPQPNLCALEADRLDPKLSSLRRLAAALELTPGTLLDRHPPRPSWSRHHIDAFVRSALSSKATRMIHDPRAKALRRAAAFRLAAAGKGRDVPAGTGERVSKQLQADLGPQMWEAVIKRMDKYL